MPAIDRDTRADRIAAMVTVVARQRADNDHPGDWTERQSYDDYVCMLRSMQAWVEGPEGDRVVVARPRMAPTGGYWTGTVVEVLDTASDRVDTDAGDDDTFRHAMIVQDDGSYTARLVWQVGPVADTTFDQVKTAALG